VRVEVDSEHTLVLSAGQHQFMTEECLTFITVTGKQQPDTRNNKVKIVPRTWKEKLKSRSSKFSKL